MTIMSRLKEYLTYKKLSARELERQCGLGNGVLGRISQSTKPQTLRRIEDNCDLDVQWLLTGEGEMLKEKVRTQVDSDSAREVEIPDRFVSYLVPMSAMGGSLIGFDEGGVSKEDCEKVVSPIADVDWVVPVCGDSMEPEYPNGSKVYVRRIDPGEFIAWGNVFVLDTTNGLIIKVVNESEKEGYVRCVSLNPSGRYAPFDVPMRSIRAMYRVMLCVSVK